MAKDKCALVRESWGTALSILLYNKWTRGDSLVGAWGGDNKH